MNNKIAEKLKSYEYLAVGWNYGNGGPISKSVITKALKVLSWADDKFEVEVFPGDDGSVIISLFGENLVLDICVEPDFNMTADIEEF